MSATTPTIDTLSITFAEEVHESERRFISSGWECPLALHKAALAHGIGGASFRDPAMSFMFYALCCSAEINLVPTERDIVGLARRGGFPLPTGIYNYLHDLRMLKHGLGGIGCMRYAEQVARNARRYQEAREHLWIARELLDNDTVYKRLLNKARPRRSIRGATSDGTPIRICQNASTGSTP